MLGKQKNNLYIFLNILISFVIANPFILFLYFKNVFLTIAIYLSVNIVLFLLFFVIKRRFFYVYTLNFLFIISLIFHIEIILRFTFPEYIIEDLYSIKNKYYLNKPLLVKNLKDKEFNTLYLTNVDGFRIGSSQFSDIQIKECDWLFLGDSYTQGAQVDFEDLFTSVLYRKFPDKIILNAGISGFGVPEEYYFFKDWGKQLKPSLVFLQICNFNDFMNVEVKSRNISDYLMHYFDFIRLLLYNFKYKPPGELPLGRWTEPFYKNEVDNINYNIFYNIWSDKKKSDLQNFVKYLKLLDSEIKKVNAKLIVFLIPTKEQLYFDDFEEVIQNYNIDVKNLDMNYPNNFLKNLCDSLGIKFIDLLKWYGESKNRVYFEYDEHLNKWGHILTAQILTDEIKGILPKSSSRILSKKYLGDRYPTYFDKGTKILFQSFEDGNMEIFIADSMLNHPKRISYDDVDEIHPFISPDNKIITFTQGNAADINTKICVMDTTGKNRRYITEDKFTYGAIPTFSHSGNLITYAEWSFDKTKSYSNPQIVILNLEDGNKICVTNDKFENWRPTFSPDDNHLLYISKKTSNFDIYEYNLLTRSEIQLTNTFYDEWDPFYSPTGDKIVYSSKKNGNWDLFIMVRSNGKTDQLTFTKGDEWDASFSSDGKKIIFGGKFGFFQGIYTLSLKK